MDRVKWISRLDQLIQEGIDDVEIRDVNLIESSGSDCSEWLLQQRIADFSWKFLGLFVFESFSNFCFYNVRIKTYVLQAFSWQVNRVRFFSQRYGN